MYSQVRKVRSRSCDMLDHIETDFEKIRAASRQRIISQGLSMCHPMISGTIPIHQDLQGELYFANPSRTNLSAGPEDFHFFLSEMNRNGLREPFPISNDNFEIQRPQLPKTIYITAQHLPNSFHINKQPAQ